MPMSKSTSRERADAHEALYLRLAALLGHITPIAARNPEAAVPGETRAIAEAVLYDCKSFVRGRGFPAAAHTIAALATQLGQAQAALEMWEAEHAFWNGTCFVWRLTRGADPAPIQRLRAKAKLEAADPEQQRQLDHFKEMLWRRVDARFGEGYEKGYADARDGIPNRKAESLPRRRVEGG